jgi:hypothetical protein
MKSFLPSIVIALSLFFSPNVDKNIDHSQFTHGESISILMDLPYEA